MMTISLPWENTRWPRCGILTIYHTGVLFFLSRIIIKLSYNGFLTHIIQKTTAKWFPEHRVTQKKKFLRRGQTKDNEPNLLLQKIQMWMLKIQNLKGLIQKIHCTLKNAHLTTFCIMATQTKKLEGKILTNLCTSDLRVLRQYRFSDQESTLYFLYKHRPQSSHQLELNVWSIWLLCYFCIAIVFEQGSWTGWPPEVQSNLNDFVITFQQGQSTM